MERARQVQNLLVIQCIDKLSDFGKESGRTKQSARTCYVSIAEMKVRFYSLCQIVLDTLCILGDSSIGGWPHMFSNGADQETLEFPPGQWQWRLRRTMLRGVLGKTFRLLGYTIQYGCIAHCTFEYIGGVVMVSFCIEEYLL